MKDSVIKILIGVIIILVLLLLGIGMNRLTYSNLIEVEIAANNTNEVQGTQIENSGDSANRTNNKIRFTDSICLAIGHIPANTDADFIDKNFNDRKEYEKLPVIKLGTSNKFAIIPKEKGGTINVWTCKMDENYQMVKDEMVACEPDTKGIIVETGEIEYIPTVIIEYIAPSSFECLVPLTFSGEDGSLNLTGNEADVMDISVEQ